MYGVGVWVCGGEWVSGMVVCMCGVCGCVLMGGVYVWCGCMGMWG